MLTKLFQKAMAMVLALSLGLSASFASAATMPVDIFPANTPFYMEVDLNQIPGFDLTTLVKSFSSTLSSESSNSDDSSELFANILASKRFYMAMDKSSLPKGFSFLLPITDSQWTTLLTLHPEVEKKSESGRDFYVDVDGAMTFAHIDSYLALSEEESVMISLLKSYSKGDVFSKSSNYLNTVNKLTGGRLMTFFLDYYTIMQSELASELGEEKELLKTLDVLRQLGFGISQFNGGVQFQTVATKGASEILQSLSPFMPSLYTSAPAKYPALYVEGNNLWKTFDAEMELLSSASDSDIEGELSDISDVLGFDIKEDLLALLTKGYSLTVEANNSSAIPYVTLMADVKGNEATIQDTLNSIQGFASSLLSLTTGVTVDGLMYISNDPSVAKKIGTGVNVSAFGNQLSSSVTSFGLVDFAQITAMIKGGIAQEYNAMSSHERSAFNFSSLMSEIDTIASPWHSMTFLSTMDSQSMTSIGKVFFDSTVYTPSYWLNVSEASENISGIYQRYERGKIKFIDVPNGAWYANDLARLQLQGIIKGYGTKPSLMTFKPGQQITRAEFLAMLYRGVYGEATIDSFFGSFDDDTSSDTFSDISIFDWHFDIVNEARNKNLIKGYDDNTFRPNALITRAEAVAMIHRFYEYNNDVEFFVDLPWRDDRAFGDVAGDTWYSAPIHTAYQLGVVDGVSLDRFEPLRNLNRAEAAKLISKLLRKKF